MLEKERHVLVILPHPDDETFGAAGTIATYRSMDVPVTYVCLTLGEMGRAFGNPPFANRENLRDIRKKELFDACEAIGLTDVRLGGFRDKTIEFEEQRYLIDRMKAYIEEVNPSLLIAFYPGHSVHPDHEASARAIVHAVAELPKEQRPTLHLIAFSNDAKEQIGEPDVHRNVAHVIDAKIDALNAHASQTIWIVDWVKEGLQTDDPEVYEWLENEYFYTYDVEKEQLPTW